MQENISMKLTVADNLLNCSNVFDVGSGHKSTPPKLEMTANAFASACQQLVTMTCLIPSARLLVVVSCVCAPPECSGWVVYEIVGIYG